MDTTAARVEQLKKLSPREREVLGLLGQGHSVEEIAELVKHPRIAPSTIYTYTSKICIKLGIDHLQRSARQRELGLYCSLAAAEKAIVAGSSPTIGIVPARGGSQFAGRAAIGNIRVAAPLGSAAAVLFLQIYGSSEFATSQPAEEYHRMLRAFQQVAHDAVTDYARQAGLGAERWHAQGVRDECLVVLRGGVLGEDEVHALRLAVWVKQGWIDSPFGKRLAQAHSLGLLPQVDLAVGVGRGNVIFDHDVWTGGITPEGAPVAEAKSIGEVSARFAPDTYILVKLDIREAVDKAALGVRFGELVYVKPTYASDGLYQVPVFPVVSWGEFGAVQERLSGPIPNPVTPAAYFNRALALQRSGRTAEACEAYSAALELHPDYRDAWNNLGVGLFSTERYPEAIRAYQEVIARDPRDEMAWYNLGLGYRALAQRKAAMEAYQQATAIRANYPEAWNEIALMHNEDGEFEEALVALETARRLAPDFTDTLYNLTCTYALQGNTAAALGSLRQAITAEPLKYRAVAREDSDLISLRGLPEFIEVLGEPGA